MNGNKCLKLDKTELGWAAARNVCKEAGADLALVIRMRMMAMMIYYDDTWLCLQGG